MWLLSTARAELRYFPSARNAAQQGYAILSHVWGEKEQTFQETETLRVHCATEDTNPRDYSTPKVRDSCIFAERHGYKWIWDDTCCIDKTSSSELSEAINSMSSYYSLADICYAYLEDVHCASDAVLPVSGQLRSQYWKLLSAAWFTRGWTLQELIAPEQVLFLSQEWAVIGTKADLADDLERITGIPHSVLRLEADVSDFSVAQRMSWAAERHTSREEDEAYCLMGLFDVNMPTVYGEGKKAFRRLQEEIMKKTIDTSLFAWGDIEEYPCRGAPGPHTADDQSAMVLFATAPSDFRHCSQRAYDPNVLRRLGIPEVKGNTCSDLLAMLKPQESSTVPQFTITSYGVHARIPMLSLNHDDVVVALLYVTGYNKPSKPLGLLLCPCKGTVDPTRPLYHTAIRSYRGMSRLLDLEAAVPAISKRPELVSWRDLYIIPSLQRASTVRPDIMRMNRGIATPFSLPLQYLLHMESADYTWSLLPKPFPFPWTGNPPARLVIAWDLQLQDMSSGSTGVRVLEIFFGCCTSPTGPSTSESSLGPHWAAFRISGNISDSWPVEVDDNPSFVHDCATDHIDDWPDREKTFTHRGSIIFGDCKRSFSLSFTPCSLRTSTTYVASLKIAEGEEKGQYTTMFIPRRSQVPATTSESSVDSETDEGEEEGVESAACQPIPRVDLDSLLGRGISSSSHQINTLGPAHRSGLAVTTSPDGYCARWSRGSLSALRHISSSIYSFAFRDTVDMMARQVSQYAYMEIGRPVFELPTPFIPLLQPDNAVADCELYML